MKRLFYSAAVVVAAVLVFGCASTSGAASDSSDGAAAKVDPPTEEWVMPDDVVSGAAGFDEEEANTPYTMADAALEEWASDGNKVYLHTGDLWSKLQYEDGGDWQADLLSNNAEFIDVGDGDKVVALNLKMNAHYGLIQNFSDQAKNPKAINNVVWKMKIYIPEQYCDPNIKDNVIPKLRFQIRDQSWNIVYLSGDIDKIPVRDLGAGWHVLTINFADSTFDFGTKTGTFRANVPRKANALEIQFDGTGYKTAYPFIFDWIAIDGLE